MSVNDRSEKVQIIVQYDFSSLHSMKDGELMKLAEHLFCENLVWRDRSLIRDAVEAYASISGFAISCSGEYIRCSRYGQKRGTNRRGLADNAEGMEKPASRDLHGGQLKCGCTFSITLSSTVKTKQLPKKTTQKSRPKFRECWDDMTPVTIKKACCVHGGLCKPSSQQQMWVRSRTGQYNKGISEGAIFTLCNFLKHNKKLKSTTIEKIPNEWMP